MGNGIGLIAACAAIHGSILRYDYQFYQQWRRVTIDATTVLSNAINGCLTISNLTMSLPSVIGLNDLIVNDTGSTALEILGAMTVSNHCTLIITNSDIALGNQLFVNGGSVLLESGSISMGGALSLGNSLDIINTGNVIVTDGTLQVNGDIILENGATLTMAAGTVISDFLLLNESSEPGAMWITGGQLLPFGIFVYGGTLVQSNGLVESETSETVGSGSPGALTLAGGTNSGAGLLIGVNGPGVVWVTGGLLKIGIGDDGSIDVGVSGVGSLSQSNGIIQSFIKAVGFGKGSVGTLTMAGGTTIMGNIIGNGLAIGGGTGSTGTVWLTGGQLIMTNGTTIVGEEGAGQMIVSNGNWQAQRAFVGQLSGGNGTLTVAGGISVVSSNLIIGTPDCTGTGALMADGGSLFVTNATHNAVLDLESGTAILRGGTLAVDVLVTNNPCGVFQQTGGTLVIGGVTNIVSPPVFSITAISLEGNNIRITWQTPGGVTNAVLVTTGGPDGSYNTNFVDLSPQLVLTNGSPITTNYLDIGGATNMPARYYRVRLVP